MVKFAILMTSILMSPKVKRALLAYVTLILCFQFFKKCVSSLNENSETLHKK